MKTVVFFILCFRFGKQEETWIMHPNGTTVDAALIEQWTFLESNPPWLVDGDVIPTNESRKVKSNAVLWPGGYIPYKLDSTMDANAVSVIQAAMAAWEANTCLSFDDVTDNAAFDNSSNHIYFTDDGTGCYSYVGMVNLIPQNVILKPGCATLKVVSHEIGHSLGFVHEHQRTGRDDYVRILWDNIQSAYHTTYNEKSTNNLVDYDIFSVMHYSHSVYTVSSKLYQVNTMQSVNPRYQFVMNKPGTITFRDEKTANLLYCAADYASGCGLGSADVCNAGYLLEDCSCRCPFETSGNDCGSGVEKDPVSLCGGTIMDSGDYTTPSFPEREADSFDRNCVWDIQAPANHKVQVYFERFDFYQRIDISSFTDICYWDRVEVRLNGSNDEGEFMCGNDYEGQTLESVDNQMVILIKSIFSNNIRDGMKFQVSFVSDVPTMTVAPTQAPIGKGACGCYEEVKYLELGEKFEAVSYHFDGIRPYPHNEFCTIHIRTVNPAYRLKAYFKRFNVDASPGCSEDSVVFRDGYTNDLIGLWCGLYTGSVYTSLTNNYIKLKFITNNVNASTGFKIRFSVLV